MIVDQQTVVQVRGLTKKYKLYDRPIDRLKEVLNPFGNSYHHEFVALSDVSFDLKKGKTVGIIGKNGSGKSTLLKILTGVLTPTSGEVMVRGKIAALLELGAGFNPELSGYENIFLNGALMGYSTEEMVPRVDEICGFADIGEYIHQPVKMYSSGMFARLAFAVAINVEPDILVIDEALSVGDFMFQYKCMQKIKALTENGVTVVYVSHSTQSVIQNCDCAIFLQNGQLKMISDDVQSVVYAYEESARGVKRHSGKNIDALLNPNEIRMGNHEATISKFELCQERPNILVAGKKTKINVTIDSKRNFDSVVLGMSIRTVDGITVWGDNTLNALEDCLSLRVGENSLVFCFDLNIYPGEYVMFVGLADISEGNRVELDQRWGMFKLNIVSLVPQAEGISFAPLRIVVT